jgi:hypothetical protein
MNVLSGKNVRPAVPPAYGEDFHAWTLDQAERLRALRPAGLDWANLAEEMESLGRSEKREIESRMAVLVLNLLKWCFQPEGRSNSWRSSIVEQRRRLAKELAASPSLRSYPAEVLSDEHEFARPKAAEETGLPLDAFPVSCPFRIEDILDPSFWPGPAEL